MISLAAPSKHDAVRAQPGGQLDRGRIPISRGMKCLQRPRQVTLVVRRNFRGQMAIHELLAVVPPPSEPFNGGPAERRHFIEKALGTALPDDFLELALRYGTGRFCGEIQVFNPFSDDYLEVVERIADLYRDLKKAEGETCVPFSIFPESPGFLPWGDSWNGFGFFWLTEGEPNQWPTVLVVPRQSEVFQTFPMQMTSFLARAFKDPLPCVLWDVEWQLANLVGGTFEKEEKRRMWG